MKRCYTLFALLVVAFLTITASDASAQSATRSSTAMLGKGNLMPDSANTFISFSPVYMEGKTYVRWLVKNDRKDGVFIVERSADGIDFEALGFKDRIGSQLDVNLFYSFVDQEPNEGDNHYRVMQVGDDNTFRYSSVIKVRTAIQPTQTGSSAQADSEKK
jgi:hypothetical protein